MYSRTQIILFSVVGGLLGIGAIVGVYFLVFGSGGNGVIPTVLPPPAQKTIEIWGLFDDSDVYQPIIDAYHERNPNIFIRYRKFIWDEYENTLISALASNRGPDIFMIHNTWMDKHLDKISPAPSNFRSPFIRTSFERGNTAYAIPLWIDNLALFYNRDLLAQEGFFNPPRTWEQFQNYVKALTRFSPTGSLLRSGTAMGTDSQTINRASDILLFLMLQNGVEPFERGTKRVSWKDNPEALNAARDALRFYTDFSNPSKEVYTWNEDQHYSIDRFWEGNLAMMFNYAYNIDTIKKKAPFLNFAVAPLPRKGNEQAITIGNYWGLAVSSKSSLKDSAWNFLSFFSMDDQYLTYITQTNRLAAQDKILKAQEDDPLLKPFIEQVRSMFLPYQPDERKMENILDEMIRNVHRGITTLDEALRIAASSLQLIPR